MIKRFTWVIAILLLGASCNRDHKKETISNYLNYIWKRQPGEIEIKTIDDVRSITGEDSIGFLIQEYAKDIKPLPSLDTILSRIGKDIEYNSNLLTKTNQRIDSLNELQKKTQSNYEFLKTYIKSFLDLRNFTKQQIDELKFYQNTFNRYSEKKAAVFSYEIRCQYKVKPQSTDTTSRLVTQTFYLSPDTRKIFLVK